MSRKEYMRQWYEDNKERVQEYRREWRERVKSLVFEFYGDKCECCGEAERAFLTIDHIDEGVSRKRYPGGGRVTGKDFYAQIVAEDFPGDLQLLCRNCNWGKHVNDGVCPHND